MKKTLLALAAGVAFLVALLVVREAGYWSSTKSRSVFDTAQAVSIRKLHVKLQDDSVTLVKSGTRWVVLPDSFPADGARLDLALSAILRVEDKEIVSKSADEGRLAEFGLSSDEVKIIRWTDASGETKIIHLGHTSATDFNSTFWKHPDGVEVYRTPGNFTHEIGVRPREWKDKTLFPAFEAAEVNAVRVRWTDSLGRRVEYTMTRVGDSTYRLSAPGAPDTAVVPGTAAARLFEHASQLVIDEVPDLDDPNLGLAALDSGAVVIQVTLKSGKAHRLVTGGTSGYHTYFRHPAHQGVVIILTSRIAFFQKTAAELNHPAPSLLNESGDIETISYPGQ